MKGVELQGLVPRLEDVSRIQQRGDEGAAQERFSAQLNQQVEERRQTVPETAKTAQERVSDSTPRERRQQQPESRADKRRRPPKEEAEAPSERGRRLDVRV